MIEHCTTVLMDAAWRELLAEVLSSADLAFLDAAVGEQEAAEAEETPMFSLFDEDDCGVGKQLLADMCSAEALPIGADDVPSYFRSPAYFKMFRAHGWGFPLIEGTSSSGHGDVVWPAAHFCAEAILSGAVDDLLGFPARVLEVGSGVGLPACAALRRGASVVATDLLDVQRLVALATTCALNRRIAARHKSSPEVKVFAHNWGDDCSTLTADGDFDLILCCDCIYFPELHCELLHTLSACLAPSGAVLVCFSLHGNVPDEHVRAFFDKAEDQGFSVDKFGERQMQATCSNFPPKRSYVFACTLRRNSARAANT